MTANWPAGVQLATITFQPPFSASADTAITSNVLVELVLTGTDTLTWQPTNQSWETIHDTYTNPNSVQVAFVDQPGFTDAGGHPYTGFAFRITRTLVAGAQRTQHIRTVQPVTGQTTIAFEDLVDASIGTPTIGTTPAVTSVNGQTGDVTIPTGGGGGGSATAYTFTNSALWSITHQLGRRPTVTLYDATGNTIDTDVYADTATATATFPTPISGTAVLA